MSRQIREIRNSTLSTVGDRASGGSAAVLDVAPPTLHRAPDIARLETARPDTARYAAGGDMPGCLRPVPAEEAWLEKSAVETSVLLDEHKDVLVIPAAGSLKRLFFEPGDGSEVQLQFLPDDQRPGLGEEDRNSFLGEERAEGADWIDW